MEGGSSDKEYGGRMSLAMWGLAEEQTLVCIQE